MLRSFILLLLFYNTSFAQCYNGQCYNGFGFGVGIGTSSYQNNYQRRYPSSNYPTNNYPSSNYSTTPYSTNNYSTIFYDDYCPPARTYNPAPEPDVPRKSTTPKPDVPVISLGTPSPDYLTITEYNKHINIIDANFNNLQFGIESLTKDVKELKTIKLQIDSVTRDISIIEQRLKGNTPTGGYSTSPDESYSSPQDEPLVSILRELQATIIDLKGDYSTLVVSTSKQKDDITALKKKLDTLLQERKPTSSEPVYFTIEESQINPK